ncbi:pectin lyase-like protein [Westerdykella ornata]|uniref:Pectin lyase-like protein n=1 Tax=Westerdykella ornata TaxID=318751 RepID=A0A6A6J6K2_WESOR|nr:pectin lyase-like protein [Westerdykella ornata]KAF2271266.1 pectin lyase-like protein [Westerdykella ornata]
MSKWTLLLSFQLCYVAVAQYLQDYIDQQIPNPNGAGTVQAYFYQATYNDVPEQVIDLGHESVWLVYNCHYMKDICKNAYNFENTPRGIYPHPKSDIAQHVYGYDFNSGRESTTHASQRRKQSCPRSWKTSHKCPEADQRTVMRHDGPWLTTELEPGTRVNQIMNRPATPLSAAEDSKVRYTCDEFPPATWVEGGNGLDGNTPAQTRCAAMRCREGCKAEQDSSSHGALRRELQRLVEQRATEFHWFDEKKSVVLFFFTMTNVPDNVASRVWSYSAVDHSNPDRNIPISQGLSRRDLFGFEGANSTRGMRRWPKVTYEEIKAHIEAGLGHETVVPANDTATWTGLAGFTTMPELGLNSSLRWQDDDLERREEHRQSRGHGHGHGHGHALGERFSKKASHPSITPLLKRATDQDISSARKIVKDAILKSSRLNKARLAQSRRNHRGPNAGSKANRIATGNSTSNSPPLLKITDEIAKAAALVAEADGAVAVGNMTRRAVAASGSYWMGSLGRKGTVPWGNDPNYKVFRNVLDYGAVGDGVTFPPGTYLISSTIPLPFGTQVIGDAIDRTTLLAAASFVGLGVLSTDEYTGHSDPNGSDQEWFINTANFYRQIRNVIIDIRRCQGPQTCAGLHYQVAQATSTQNLEIIAAPGSSQIGIFAENGSGGQISDVVFRGGAIGLYGGEQQFTAQRLTFDGCTTGVQVIWDWGWVWKSVTMTNVDVGFKLVSDNGAGNIGSVTIMDSSFSNVGTAAVIITPPSSRPATGSTGIVLDKVSFSGVAAAVKDTSGAVLLDKSTAKVDQWTLGPIYEGSTTARSYSQGSKIGHFKRHSTLLDANGMYFERPKPQYDDRSVGDFIHLKDLGAAGDGVTDDTAAVQLALYAAQGKILFVDAGSYILTSTVMVPPGSKIVGETWSQFVASGSYFQDANNPKVMIRVGKEGDVGNVEMQDIIFTTRGPTAGAILVQWNIEAVNAGSAGMWDCHVRIGGATGTELTPAECPPVTSRTNTGCNAASLMMHLTNDPDLDDPSDPMVQTSIYVARGLLVESTKPTWMYGTASEHAVFYQYNFHKAKNIFAGMIQTESPYYQPTPPPPAPFDAVVGKFVGDPNYDCAAGDDFNGCDESWAVIIRESQNIFVAAAGLYSWFSTYTQDCIDLQACQKALVLLDSNGANIRIQNLITIGAKYMAVMNGKGILATDNLNVDTHPEWSQVSVLDVASDGAQFEELSWVHPSIWDMEQPAFTCSPPCHVKIPPWTGATRTVDYPLLTVSEGTWTSTITKAPLTITDLMFDVVTLTQGSSSNGKLKRQGFEAFMPTPATTPFWPSVVYTGPDGRPTTTAPTVAFPPPPASIGPGAPPPAKGSWPKRDIIPHMGDQESPMVPECAYFDTLCFVDKPWLYGGNNETGSGSAGGSSFDPDDENWEDLQTVCPRSQSSTSTRPTPTSKIQEPTPSPYEHGDPMQNEVHCYNSGETTERVRMENAANSFCKGVGEAGDILIENFFQSNEYPFPYNGGIGTVKIKISLEVAEGCVWAYDYDECRRYLRVPTDSCNCGGVNGKEGGVVSNNCLSWRIDPNRQL